MVIQHNLTAMNSNRQLGLTTGIQAKSSEKLSSGYKINRAADDAAGLAISEKMRRQIRGLHQGSENVQDGISMLQTAEGALAEVHDMLQRMNELSVKAGNDTLVSSDRQYIQQEIDALISEIDRVGISTTFNDRHILGDIHVVAPKYKKMTDLVKCSAADSGYLSEAYEKGGRFYPAATLDFSGVGKDDIDILNDKGFSFICPMGCGETFKFTFKSDTNENSFEGSTTIGSGTHHFTLGIADCENGTDIVNKMFDYIVEKFGAQQGLTPGADSLKVAHDNIMEKTGGAAFVIYAPGEGQATEAAAKNYFKSLHDSGSNRAKVDCSSLSGDVIDNENRDLWIQAGADKGDGMYVTIPRINGETVGVRSVDVTTGSSARSAIDTVKKGIEYISKERATLGAQQNRLEHTYKNVTNVEENTTAAESRIRDTDMADEMVRYSNNNILAQAGQAMLAQANQTNQGVLSLLQ